MVGEKHNVLENYVNVCAPSLSGIVVWNPFKWDILWFIILIKNIFFCVPTTLAKQILFHSHKNKKLVGGIHNDLVHYVNVYAPNSSSIVLCNPSKWDILWFILIKKLDVFVPTTTAKRILFCNKWTKSCRRLAQCSNTLCEC